ncbi:MAG: hypothetical protein RML33_10910 [Acidobacteriota bacterium]|nr:hypothetical protein [Acidobacteriota bacterium]
MRIGRLRARLRRDTESGVEPKYYHDYTFLDAFGEDLKAEICPFDGKAFLNWSWDYQSSSIWYSHSVNGLIPTALIDYSLEWRKETKANEENRCFFTIFPWPYDDIIVNCTCSLEGVWIGGDAPYITVLDPYITVLETTRMKVEFKAETREVLLPPGATIFLSPLTLMQKLGENISIEKRERRLPTQVMEVFTSAKTPQELAARLELEPIRLREEMI